MKIKILALLSLFLFFSINAFALSGSAPTGTGTVVTGCCGSGPIATPMDVAMDANWTALTINEQILKGFQASISNDQATLKALMNQEDANRNFFKDLLESYGKANQKAEIERKFGNSAQTFMGCLSAPINDSMRIGKEVEKSLNKKIKNDFIEYNKEWDTREEAELNSLKILSEDSTPISDYLFPANKTLTNEELGKAMEKIKVITNDSPYINNIPKHIVNPLERARYEKNKSIYENNVSIVQSILADQISYVAPTSESGVYLNNLFNSIGGNAEGDNKPKPVGILSDNKTMSRNAYMESMMTYYGETPGYIDSLAKKDTNGLLKELIDLQILHAKINNEILKETKKGNIIKALEFSQKIK